MRDFTPDDVLRGIKAWLCIGTLDALRSLQPKLPKEDQ